MAWTRAVETQYLAKCRRMGGKNTPCLFQTLVARGLETTHVSQGTLQPVPAPLLLHHGCVRAVDEVEHRFRKPCLPGRRPTRLLTTPPLCRPLLPRLPPIPTHRPYTAKPDYISHKTHQNKCGLQTTNLAIHLLDWRGPHAATSE